jgi:hypothetical protein
MDRNQFIEAAEALDFPRAGVFAELLWRASKKMPRDEAESLFRDCGYIPFAGYPLTPAGRPRRLLDADRQRVLDSNPLCSLGRPRPQPTVVQRRLSLEWTWRDPHGNAIAFVRRPKDAEPAGFSHDVVINGAIVDRLARPIRPSCRVAEQLFEKHYDKGGAG